MKIFLMFINFSFFLQKVASLGLTLQPSTFVARPSLLFWTRQPIDGKNELNFDLRFVQGVDKKDAGIAISGIHASPTQQFGTAEVVFPTQGTYEVIAVSGPNNNIGTSNDVNVVALPSASTTVSDAPPTSKPASVFSLSAVSGPTSKSKPNTKVPIIVGSIFATVLLAVLVMLIIFVIRCRRKTTKRGHHPPPAIAQTSQGIPSSASIAPRPWDLEQGFNTLAPAVPSMQPPNQDLERRSPDPVVCPTTAMAGPRGRTPVPLKLELDPSYQRPLPRIPIGPRSPLIPRSPLTPRPSLPRSPKDTISPGLISRMPRSPGLMSPMPRSPGLTPPIPRSLSPRTHRQRAIADQIEILRVQMLEFEREGRKDDIAMDDMCKKMAWLREQQEGSWALGLTEATPLGYDRYMT